MVPALDGLGERVIETAENPRRPIPTAMVMTDFILLAMLAALAALHRPWRGASLGLGTMVLPIAVERLSEISAVLVATFALLGAEAVRRAVLRRVPGWIMVPGRLLESGLVVAAATLAGAGAWRLAPGTGAAVAAAAGAYSLTYAGLRLVAARLRGAWQAARGQLPTLALDVAGWALGALVLASAGPDDTGSPVALLVLGALALLAAEAARNALLRIVSEHRVDDFKRIHRAHHRILAETSGMADIAQQILAECRKLLPVAWFQLETLGGDEGRRSWSSGPDGRIAEGEPAPPTSPPALPGIHRRARWKVLEKPLEAGGEILAELRLWCDPRRVEPGSEELLATLLPQMASSLHRARLDREAKRDPLTGVYVRRVLETRLEDVYRHAREEGRSMAVVMCDIDHFKRINDTWGHAAGDEALKLVAQTLDAERRERDLCCRYGGEEFTLLLDETPGLQALRLAERLRREVEALDFVYGDQHVPLRLSAGVAAFPELHAASGAELLTLADAALYRAKENGRNQCLLNLGQGRLRDVHGRTLGEATGDTAPPTAPRIFT